MCRRSVAGMMRHRDQLLHCGEIPSNNVNYELWFFNIFWVWVMHLSLFWSSKLMMTSPLYEKLQKKSLFSWSIGPHCLWDLLLAPKSTVFVWFEPVAPTCANKGYIYVKEDIFPVLGVYVICLCNLVLTYRVMLKISLNTICNSAYSN